MSKSVFVLLDNRLSQDSDLSLEEESEIVDSILLDLKYLLNSYAYLDDLEERSILGYGIPDLTSYLTSLDSDQKHVIKLIKSCINKYEKRLSDVEVAVKDACYETATFRLIIKANLTTKTKKIPLHIDSQIVNIHQVIRLYQTKAPL